MGICPCLSAEAAALDVIFVLQQVLASSHANAARLAFLNNIQAHPQPHQQEHLHRQQLTRPLQLVAQPRGGRYHRWPAGAVGRRSHGMLAAASTARRKTSGFNARGRQKLQQRSRPTYGTELKGLACLVSR